MGYFTRQKGKNKLNKLVKEVITAFSNLLEYNIEAATEKEKEATVDYIAEEREEICEDKKIDRRRIEFLMIIEAIVKNEEPGETDDYEENESLVNLADSSVTAADMTFNQAVKGFEACDSKRDSVFNESLVPVCERSVTAADMTMDDLLKNLKTATPKGTEEFVNSSDHPNRFFRPGNALSLASLLTSTRRTPLRSASSHSLLDDETRSRRARRSSLNLAQLLLSSDRGQMTPSQSLLEESVICLGSVKKSLPPPVVITLEDTPLRPPVSTPLLNDTPKSLPEFSFARARLRRVKDSPVEKEVRRLQDLMEVEEESPKKTTPKKKKTPPKKEDWPQKEEKGTPEDLQDSPCQTTDRRVVSMEICSPYAVDTQLPTPKDLQESPQPTTDRRVVSMEMSTPSPPKPALPNRLGTPFPFFGKPHSLFGKK